MKYYLKYCVNCSMEHKGTVRAPRRAHHIVGGTPTEKDLANHS